MAEILYTTKKSKISDSPQRIRLVRGDETQKEKWLRCVKEAKLLTTKRDQAKIRICELCLEACGEINWGGGGHWSGFQNQVTVTQFAVDIGMHPKTLLEWMAVKRYIFDNLNKKYHTDFKWSVLAKIRRELRIKRDVLPSKTKVTALYEKFLDATSTPAFNIKKYLTHITYSLDKVEHLEKDDKAKIKEMCVTILNKLKT